MAERSVHVDQRRFTALVDVGDVGLNEHHPTGVVQCLSVPARGLDDPGTPGVEPTGTHGSGADRRL